jgi:Domain of unknown function (DUF4386)
MSISAITQPTVEAPPRLEVKSREVSPRSMARLAGVFSLLTILGGVFAQGFIAERLVVSGNAAATATNILTHVSLYRLGFAVYLIELACQIMATVLLYNLLKPVSKSVSLLAAIFGVAGCVIKVISRLFFIAPIFVLGGSHYLNVFSAEQLQALALLFLRVDYQAETMAMIFFGFYALLKGYLVFRSTFLPRILGVLGVVGGLGLLTYLYEPLAARLVLYVLAVALVGAVSNILWLLIFGVNEHRWKEQAAT